MYDNSMLVSIVIPVYNEEAFLSECIDSLLLQTHSNIQIICVDDGSTDDSLEILKHYSKIDERITVIKQNNQFAGAARNNGFSVVEGDYVLFLDSDDWFDHSMIQKMLSKIVETDSDIFEYRDM